ncbi:dihydrodipicolinate synthase family protein [Streptomyces sp. NPDC058092]|uniref:dihydrodipicolinate synthase family protein n=1 Tax=Streptomyces sp. NPDC058092 TaxID=3346336 RepID=UPI0036E887E0
MAGGVLSFPLTSFRDDGSLDLDSYRTYLTAQVATAPGAVFPACGTGEFSALDEDEYRAVVEAAVDVADGRLPVVAGIQARAYATVGVPAVHAFAPEIADACFTALRDGDNAAVSKLLCDFCIPLVELRDRAPGYAVCLVKAAARRRGLPVGPVRAPLTDPCPADLADLEQIPDAGLNLVGAIRRRTA